MLTDPNINKSFTGHWTFEESTRYFIFLTIYQENFGKKSLRRSEKIFKEMSRFIKTRTADQCRSHHQKMEKKCLTLTKILVFLENSYSLTPNLRESLTIECLDLRKNISEESDSGLCLIKQQ